MEKIVDVLRVSDENSRAEVGSVSQRCRSADPDQMSRIRNTGRFSFMVLNCTHENRSRVHIHKEPVPLSHILCYIPTPTSPFRRPASSAETHTHTAR